METLEGGKLESDIWINHDRYINLLQAENKLTRKSTLIRFLREIQALSTAPRSKVKKENEPAAGQPDGDSIVQKTSLDEDDIEDDDEDKYDPSDKEKLQPYMRALLILISDPMEKCRELAYEALNVIAGGIVSPGTFVQYLPSLIPILLERLGQQELNESSEEVRLVAVEFILALLTRMEVHLAPFVDDLIQIMAATLIDPFHSVRKVSCQVVSNLAKGLPQVFHYSSDKLLKPLCTTITHQQFRIRVAVVECIGNVIIYGSHKSVADVVPSVTMRLFDPSPNVRKAVVQVVARWMMDFVDRYSHFQRFIPIILIGLCDEAPDVKEEAETLWAKIGSKYLEENIEEYKDQVDFPLPPPAHYPNGVKRPNFGCRVLTWRHVCNIIPAVSNDINDWMEGNREKSAQLMYFMILNCEEKITMHVEKLLQTMFRACLDKNTVVIDYVLKSANLIGYFVPLSTTWPILSTTLTASSHEGCLAITSAILQASEPTSLSNHCEEILTLISSDDLSQTLLPNRQQWILRICEAFLDLIREECENTIGFKLFVTLITVLAMGKVDRIQSESSNLIRKLQQVSGLTNVDQVFAKYCEPILVKIQKTCSEWTPLTPDKLIFATILSQGGLVVQQNMDVILDILIANLEPEKDPEVRLKFFTLLSQVLSSYNLASCADSTRIQNLQTFVMNVVEHVLSPSLVWKAGKTASALRTSALACLLRVLEGDLLETKFLLSSVHKLRETCVGLVDDNFNMNRLVACQCLGLIATRCPKQMPAEIVHNTYIELLKRMDDEDDNVRLSACLAIAKLFTNLPEDYDVKFFKVHLETAYRCLLLYLDDDVEDIQKCVYEVLQEIGVLSPELIIEECVKAEPKLRNGDQCTDLINFFRPYTS